MFSWIWTAGGGPGEDEVALHESVRVEWSKAKARRDRWVEEVALLREEMCRTLRMLRFIQQYWRQHAELRAGAGVEVIAGVKAYAMRQAALHRRIAESFYNGWNRSLAMAVKDTVAQDGTMYREILDGHAMDSAVTVGLEEIEEAEEAAAVGRRTHRQAAAAAA